MRFKKQGGRWKAESGQQTNSAAVSSWTLSLCYCAWDHSMLPCHQGPWILGSKTGTPGTGHRLSLVIFPGSIESLRFCIIIWLADNRSWCTNFPRGWEGQWWIFWLPYWKEVSSSQGFVSSTIPWIRRIIGCRMAPKFLPYLFCFAIPRWSMLSTFAF
jgi:hypothetical protein